MNSQPTRNMIAFLSIFFLFIGLHGPLHGKERPVLYREGVIVVFDEPLAGAANEVADIYPVIKRELEKTFTWSVNFRPTVLLVRKSQDFQRLTGNDLFVAFVVPAEKFIAIDYSKMRAHPFSIGTALKHEMCHLLLHSYIKKENLPRWLDEGIAQWVSDGMAEIIMNQRRSVLYETLLSGEKINIYHFTERPPRDKRALFLAYEGSKSLVEYIVREFGTAGILLILKYLREGSPIDVAILEALSISFDELDRKWQNHLKKKVSWFVFLSAHLYEILFFLAAVLMIIGFLKRLMEKKDYTT